MNRIGWLSLGLTLYSTVPVSAQRSRSASDSLAVEVASAAPQHRWEVNVVRDVPLLADSQAAASLSAPGHHWQVNVIRDVPFLSEAEAAADRAANVSRASVAAASAGRTFTSRRDRLAFEAARRTAERATGYRIVVDIGEHRLWVIDGRDTLRTVSVATASNETLTFDGKSWHFKTPRGVRTVLAKEKDPVWTPPEWHYAEVASEYGLRLRHLRRGQTVRINDGTLLTTKGDEVGIIPPGETEFIPLVLDSHIVFDNTLFIPPVGTKHRSIQGELGHFRLKLGGGYQLHGTPYAASIGSSVTHGCVRMSDDDIEWMYHHVRVGTKVYLY